ncbi:MAG TPA: YceI family protein [Steroidobacteraceae bacterium]|jgi:polyisoprenoid-binding protein YceI|nr:YceI family protein [Steroidobacteraceae bacterium]
MIARGILAPTLLGAAFLANSARADAPVTHYVSDPAKSTLEFSFQQAGAQNKGKFTRFPVKFDFAPDNLAGSRLEVTIDMTSLDSGDKERDDTLRGADLFAVAKFPQARFLATQFAKTAAGYEAIGKLTIRDATRDARVPFALRAASEGGASVTYMTGKTTIKRLDYGVGQGDWKATDQVGNDVVVSFNLRLTGAAH